MSPQPRIALFTGSFNPFTIGHASIVKRGLRLFDQVVIGVGINRHKDTDLAEIEDRCAKIRALYADEPRVKVEWFDGLAVTAAKHCGAETLLRGVRCASDFEYEMRMADINRQIAGIETVMLTALPELAYVSSSVVRELESFGVDVSSMLPKIPIPSHSH